MLRSTDAARTVRLHTFLTHTPFIPVEHFINGAVPQRQAPDRPDRVAVGQATVVERGHCNTVPQIGLKPTQPSTALRQTISPLCLSGCLFSLQLTAPLPVLPPADCTAVCSLSS